MAGIDRQVSDALGGSSKLSMEEMGIDIYRDTPVRLLGYANEVGEAFRSLVHVNVVRFSYGVASAYVLADTMDKVRKMSKRPWPDVKTKNERMFNMAVDTLLWQSLASVIIPGFTINRLCATSGYLLRKFSRLPTITRKWTVTAIGLGCIPFIVKPIDESVHYMMDKTIRRYLNVAKE